MSEELLVRHCSPTLAGLKTASMFSCGFASEEEMRNQIRNLNKRFAGKGLCIIPLRYGRGKGLVYVFRPQMLKKDLCDGEACSVLKERGYPCEHPAKCLTCLANRVRGCSEVPHEIGLFLGYPPEDVVGFLENRTPCSCSGLWKAYGDAEEARKRFASYKACTNTYCDQYAGGKALEHLVVPS